VPEIELLEFLDPSGKSPFARWFDNLNAVAAARVTIGLTRLRHGNFSNVESVGTGVSELKLDFGPGYRVYFGKDGERIVILLGGSAKKRQGNAIVAAQAAWAEYKRRKAAGSVTHGADERV
jgi:putative addiction module killer protein